MGRKRHTAEQISADQRVPAPAELAAGYESEAGVPALALAGLRLPKRGIENERKPVIPADLTKYARRKQNRAGISYPPPHSRARGG